MTEDPLIQDAQDPRGGTPDITFGIRHGVIGALHAAEFLAVKLMVRRVHQECQRHLEGIIDLGSVDVEGKPGCTRATVGRMRNPKPVP